MSIPLEILAKLLSPLIAAVIAALTKHYLEARPRLVTYLVHASAIPLPVPGQPNAAQVNTHSIVVANTGKKTANNVRIGHLLLPPSHQVWPPVNHQVANSPNGAAEIIIPTLVPGEQVSISYLYFPPVTWQNINSYAKSDECMARVINVIPSPQPNKLVLFALWFLVFIGASTVIYWLIFQIAAWLQ